MQRSCHAIAHYPVIHLQPSCLAFVFFIAIEYSSKKKLNRELLAEQKLANAKTITDETRARVLRQIESAKREVLQMRGWINTVYGVCLSLLLALNFATHGNARRDALFGYAAGYTDAKTGKPPRAEPNLQELISCVRRRTDGHPMPPTPGCEETMTFQK